MHVHECNSFTVIIREKSLNENSSYMHRRTVILHWEFFILTTQSCYISFCFFAFGALFGAWRMHGKWCCHLSLYLEHGTYPAVFTKYQKFALRRSYRNYKLLKGKLYYKEQIQDGTDMNDLLWKEVKQIDARCMVIASLRLSALTIV